MLKIVNKESLIKILIYMYKSFESNEKWCIFRRWKNTNFFPCILQDFSRSTCITPISYSTSICAKSAQVTNVHTVHTTTMLPQLSWLKYHSLLFCSQLHWDSTSKDAYYELTRFRRNILTGEIIHCWWKNMDKNNFVLKQLIFH